MHQGSQIKGKKLMIAHLATWVAGTNMEAGLELQSLGSVVTQVSIFTSHLVYHVAAALYVYLTIFYIHIYIAEKPTVLHNYTYYIIIQYIYIYYIILYCIIYVLHRDYHVLPKSLSIPAGRAKITGRPTSLGSGTPSRPNLRVPALIESARKSP